MTKITSVLNDTLNVVQLARETARIQGNQAQAEQLKPVVDGLRTLVGESRENKPAPVAGIAGQSDFRALLAAAARGASTPQASATRQSAVASPADRAASPSERAASPSERAQIILAMASGGMSDLDIARQMGMTRDEIRLVLSIHRD